MPEIKKDMLLDMLEKMLQIRHFEQQVDKFYMEGKVHGKAISI